MSFVLGTREFRVIIMIDLSVSVQDDQPGISSWCASYKPQRDPKIEVLSNHKWQHHAKHPVKANVKKTNKENPVDFR